MEEIPNQSYFYFVHSYYVDPVEQGDVITETDYSIDYASIIGRDNVYGIQFHPEKSQDKGLRILKNFYGIRT